jgi:type IV fimbrial biogenesis protein FimT
MKRSALGFTMIELMMTLALAAVLLGVGVPAFRDYARNGRLTGGANELLITIVAARNAAMRSNTNTSVCPSASPDSDGATCAAGATEGWIAFLDENGDCQRDPTDEKIAQMVIHSQVEPASNASCLQFRRNGFRQPIAGQPATARVMFCDTRGNTALPDGTGNSYARGLEVLPTGRAYVSRQFAELSSWAGATDPVSCP